MSVKDVKQYYDQITADYAEMVNTLKEMEDLAAQDIVNPDKVDEIKAAIEPLKNNYQRISYIMFLLNMPNRKEKKSRYARSQAKFLNSIAQDRTEHDENVEVIKAMNDVWTGNKED